MDFAWLPPEVNSGRVYAGPGSGSMLAAAEAWDSLAVELHSGAAAYTSAVSRLIEDWQGPSSTAMVTAVQPFIAWLNATAERAEQTGSRAATAAAAFQSVFAAVVPPAVIAANRTLLAALVATNIVGQNTAAIAATEAAYGEMWVQDAAAMYVYAESSSAAAQLSSFEQPPATARQSPSTSGAPGALQHAAAAAVGDPTDADIAGIQNLGALVSQVQAGAVVSVISGLGIAAQNLGATLDAAAAAGAGPALAATPESASLATVSAAEPTIAVETGTARMVGSLSAPPSWAAATPTVRLAAAAVSGIGVPTAAVTASLDSAIGQMALASVAGNALGGGASTHIKGPATPKGRPVSADGETPDKITRVLAHLAQEPESVQHWHTDKAHLDGLLEQLSTRPGIHTVHVSKKTRFTTKLSGPC